MLVDAVQARKLSAEGHVAGVARQRPGRLGLTGIRACTELGKPVQHGRRRQPVVVPSGLSGAMFVVVGAAEPTTGKITIVNALGSALPVVIDLSGADEERRND